MREGKIINEIYFEKIHKGEFHDFVIVYNNNMFVSF